MYGKKLITFTVLLSACLLYNPVRSLTFQCSRSVCSVGLVATTVYSDCSCTSASECSFLSSLFTSIASLRSFGSYCSSNNVGTAVDLSDLGIDTREISLDAVSAIYNLLDSTTSFDLTALNNTQIIALLSTDIINNCLTNCSNHGLCKYNSDSKSFVCNCESDYAGLECKTNLNQCSSSPCLNNGNCSRIGLSGFTCSCKSNYYGTYCENRVNLCSNVSCSGHGYCQIVSEQPVCKCYTLYSGDNCQYGSNKNKLISTVRITSTVVGFIGLASLYVLMVAFDIDYFIRRYYFKDKTVVYLNEKDKLAAEEKRIKLLNKRLIKLRREKKLAYVP